MTNIARKGEARPRIELYLRIKHPTIDPNEISQALELEPDYANRAGTVVNDKGVRKEYSESYWLAVLPLPQLKDLLAWDRPPAYSMAMKSSEEWRAARRLGHTHGVHDFWLSGWLQRLDGQRAFLKRIIDESGTVTLVVQRTEPSAPLNLGPTIFRKLADMEIALEIE